MQKAAAAVGAAAGRISESFKGAGNAAEAAGASMSAGLGHGEAALDGLMGKLAAFAAAWSAYGLVKKFAEIGIESNRSIRGAGAGIGALVSAQSVLTDSQGHVLTGVAAYRAALALGTDQIQKLRVASIQTASTTEEMVSGFQSAVGVGLSAGMSLDEIRNVTVRVVQAATAMQRPMETLRHELVGMINGDITRESVISKNLGLTREQILQWREQGTLAKNLLARLEPFKVAGQEMASSWGYAASSLREAFHVIAEQTTEPLFEGLRKSMNDVLHGIFDTSSGTIMSAWEPLIHVGQSVFGEIAKGAQAGITLIVNAVRGLSSWLDQNRARVAAFFNAVKDAAAALFGTVGPLVGVLLSLLDSALGPITTILQFLADILSTTAGKAALFAYLFGGKVLSAVQLVASRIPSVIAALQLIPSACAGGVSGLSALASATSGLLNPWLLLAAAVVGAVIAIERWSSAEKRAIEEQRKQIEANRAASEEFDRMGAKLLAVSRQLDDGNTPADRRKELMSEQRAIIEQLNRIYPGFIGNIKAETASEKEALEALVKINEQRQKDLGAKTKEIEAQKLALEARKAQADRELAAAETQRYAGATSGSRMAQGSQVYADTKRIADAKDKVKELDEQLKLLGAQMVELKEAHDKLTAPEPPVTVAPPTKDPPPDKQAALLEKMKAELEETKSKLVHGWDWTNERELEFWKKRIGTLSAKSAQHLEVQRTINNLEQKIRDEAWAATEAKRQQELQSLDKTDRQRLQLAEEHADAMGVRYGKDSAEYAKALADMDAIRRDIEQRERAAAVKQIEAKRDAALAEVDLVKTELEAEEHLGLISHSQFLAAMQSYYDERYRIISAALDAEAKLKGTTKEQQGEIEGRRGKAKGDRDMGKKENKVALDENEAGNVTGFVDRMTSGWAAGLAKMLQRQMSFAQAIKGIWKSIGSAITEEIANWVVKWAVTQLKMLALTIATKIKELIFHKAVEKAKQASTASTASAEVGAKAASAGASAAASAAETPGIGWMIAIPAALAVVAGVMALRGSIGSAAGGWDIGMENPIAQLHQREMVLPARYADVIRGMAAGGGAAAPATIHNHQWNVSTMDAASFEVALRDRKGPLVKILNEILRDGRRA
jgi:hypothetical protein